MTIEQFKNLLRLSKTEQQKYLTTKNKQELQEISYFIDSICQDEKTAIMVEKYGPEFERGLVLLQTQVKNMINNYHGKEIDDTFLNMARRNKEQKAKLRLQSECYVTGVEKTTVEKKEHTEKKKGKAIKRITIFLGLYLIINLIVSTAAVRNEYGVDVSNNFRVGTDLYIAEEEMNKVPDGAVTAEFIENLNPIELGKTIVEVVEENNKKGR